MLPLIQGRTISLTGFVKLVWAGSAALPIVRVNGVAIDANGALVVSK